MKLAFSLLGAFALVSSHPNAWAAGNRVALTGNANLRSKPSLDAEILASLKKGDVLEASPNVVANPKATSDEPTEWVELTAPASAKVWIAAALVDVPSKKVKAERAHLRAGPGTNFAEVGHVPKGTEVDVANRLDGWIRISAPAGAVKGYVAASLTRPVDQGPTDPANASSGKVAPAPTNPPMARMVPPPPSRPPALRPGTTPLPPNASRPVVMAGRVVPPGSSVAARPIVVPPPVPASQPVANTVPALPAPVPTPAETATAAAVPTESAPPTPSLPSAAPVEPSIPVTSGSGRQAELVFMNEKPRQVVRQGVVALAVSPQAPGRYQLDSFRRGEGTLGFLISDDATLDFEKWRAKQVVIQGEEYRDARWRTRSVIKVKSIEAVP